MRRPAIVMSLFLALSPAWSDEPPVVTSELGFAGYLGSLQTDLGSGYSGGGPGVFLGFAMEWKLRPRLIGSLDISDTVMDYDVPTDLGLYAEDEVLTNTFWVTYLFKGVLTAKRFEFYAGAGPALGFSKASVGSTSCFILCSGDSLYDESDWGFGLQGVAGFDVSVGDRSRLGLEYRRLTLDVDFGPLSAGEADVGGDAFLLVYRRR